MCEKRDCFDGWADKKVLCTPVGCFVFFLKKEKVPPL